MNREHGSAALIGEPVGAEGEARGSSWAGSGALGLIAAIGVGSESCTRPGRALASEAADRRVLLQLIPHALDQGRGFLLPFGIHGQSMATAQHPPFYPLVLAALGELGGTGEEAQRLAGSFFGLGTILTIALLARRLAGERVALVAAAIAAIYPTLIGADGALMSESLYGLLIGLSLLSAYRLLDLLASAEARPSGRS